MKDATWKPVSADVTLPAKAEFGQWRVTLERRYRGAQIGPLAWSCYYAEAGVLAFLSAFHTKREAIAFIKRIRAEHPEGFGEIIIPTYADNPGMS